MSLTPFQNPLFALFQDRAISELFVPARTLSFYNEVEAALVRAAAAEGLVSPEAEARVLAVLADFAPDPERLAEGSQRDGVPIPAYVRALRAAVGEPHAGAAHIGSTTQDIMDTALALALREANDAIAKRLAHVIAALGALDDRFGDAPLMGRTRMQAALPITAGHRIATWRRPLVRQQERLPAAREAVERLQLGGAVGTRDGWGGQGDAIARRMADTLGLIDPGAAWHTERDGIAHYGAWLSTTAAALGKFGQDIALMAQQGFGEAAVAGGGGSSAMPHKQNPVAAEALVSLARFTATQLSALHHAAVAEQERSGIAWAIEWMVLPQLVTATGAALLIAGDLAGAITRLGTPPEN